MGLTSEGVYAYFFHPFPSGNDPPFILMLDYYHMGCDRDNPIEYYDWAATKPLEYIVHGRSVYGCTVELIDVYCNVHLIDSPKP